VSTVAVGAADFVTLAERYRRELHVHCYRMLAAMAPLLERAFGADRDGDWCLLPTRANRMPAAASYLRRPGDSEFRAFKLDVLCIERGAISEITTFGYSLFPAFGLPRLFGQKPASTAG
jgi:hypothetical protein